LLDGGGCFDALVLSVTCTKDARVVVDAVGTTEKGVTLLVVSQVAAVVDVSFANNRLSLQPEVLVLVAVRLLQSSFCSSAPAIKQPGGDLTTIEVEIEVTAEVALNPEAFLLEEYESSVAVMHEDGLGLLFKSSFLPAAPLPPPLPPPSPSSLISSSSEANTLTRLSSTAAVASAVDVACLG
jgi:hypothetical protein